MVAGAPARPTKSMKHLTDAVRDDSPGRLDSTATQTTLPDPNNRNGRKTTLHPKIREHATDLTLEYAHPPLEDYHAYSSILAAITRDLKRILHAEAPT